MASRSPDLGRYSSRPRMPSADVPKGIVAAKQNLRYRHIGEERSQRRPVRLERDIIMELTQFMSNAIRHFLGELPTQSHHRSVPGEDRNGSAGVAKYEKYVWEARECSGE